MNNWQTYKAKAGYRVNDIRQRGYVLVIGMVFLLILMIGAVTLMTGTTQDEKMSGNARRSADAFMAAEAGMQATMKKLWQNHQDQTYNPPAWFYYTCEDGELVDADGEVFAAGTETEFIGTTAFGDGGSTYRVFYGGMCENNDNGIVNVSMLSEGTQSQSARKIHFNVSHDGEVTWPAVFVNEDEDNPSCSFDFGRSNSYLYDGRGGPAISTNHPDCATAIRNADTSDGQLKGGVIAHNPAPDFTDPSGLKAFYSSLIAEYEKPTPSIDIQVIPDASASNQGPVFKKQDLPSDMGTPGDLANGIPPVMKTTIFHGDLNLSGGGSSGVSGAGVLIVTGTADFQGTPHWDGLIIVLGGEVNIGGGGASDGLNGSLIVSNIAFDEVDYNKNGHVEKAPSLSTDWDHAPTGTTINWDVSGGGNALYNYGCENLMLTDQMLEGVAYFPGPNSCPPAGAGNPGSFGSLYVFDWYEEVIN